ncbi:MAG: hypothetical protein NVS4B3_04590 [Gemmatimonadaceae bacterium]
MIGLLALRNVVHRPLRSAFLFLGYGLGVAVMIVLLSIGEALVVQASDERLVGGGTVTVLPEGLDIEVMKTGGLGGMFFSIDRARFVYLQLLASPRLAGSVVVAAPQIDGKLIYLRLPSGREIPVRAAGEIPSTARAVGALPPLAGGTWADDDADRAWLRPTPAELRHEIDHFHNPPATARTRDSWAEWHYFNVLSADNKRWAFVSFILAGDVGATRWGGQVAITVRSEGGPTRKFTALAPPSEIRFSTTDANLAIGPSTVRVLADGRYAVHAVAKEAQTGIPLVANLVITPAANAYFPGASLGGDGFVSGYVVPGLRADAVGSLCIATSCEHYERAQSYHDHNWGLWRGVSWEWGATRAGPFTLLYGRVEPPDSVASPAPLFVYLVDSLGFRSVFRPERVVYQDGNTIRVDGRPIRVPSSAVMVDVRGGDTLRLELTIEDAIGTDTRGALVERGEQGLARNIARPYFIQMKGAARLTGRIGGVPLRGAGTGFFETYR